MERATAASKFCRKCQTDLPAEAFYLHPEHKDGLSSSCKECLKTDNKRRYHAKYKGCLVFRAVRSEYRQKWYAENGTAKRQRNRDNHRIQREICIKHYGGKCACCGESRYEFLALDHVDGGGQKHAREVGNKICRWLIRNGFPPEPRMRVLCHNCNLALGFYGFCPHEREAQVAHAS